MLIPLYQLVKYRSFGSPDGFRVPAMVADEGILDESSVEFNEEDKFIEHNPGQEKADKWFDENFRVWKDNQELFKRVK